MALTPKQQRFADEYLIDLNATAAYKRAGYFGQGRSAENASSRLLGNVGVAQYVKEAMDKRSTDLGIDAKYVLTTIRQTIEDCRKLDRPDSTNILKGCELLGRHLKMFTDKVENTGKDGGPIQHSVASVPELSKEEWMAAHGLGTTAGAAK